MRWDAAPGWPGFSTAAVDSSTHARAPRQAGAAGSEAHRALPPVRRTLRGPAAAPRGNLHHQRTRAAGKGQGSSGAMRLGQAGIQKLRSLQSPTQPREPTGHRRAEKEGMARESQADRRVWQPLGTKATGISRPVDPQWVAGLSPPSAHILGGCQLCSYCCKAHGAAL